MGAAAFGSKCDRDGHPLIPDWAAKMGLAPVRYDRFGVALYRYDVCACGARSKTWSVAS